MPDNAPTPAKGEWRLCARLQLDAEQSQAFVTALRAGASARRALVLSPLAPEVYRPPFPCESAETMPWLPPRVYVPEPGVRPAVCSDYNRGLYYILDLSSCWESAALSCVAPPHESLDLCAAPGGKTMLLCARYRGALCGEAPTMRHIANEVSPSRRGILRQNLALCGLPQVDVTGLRPDQWREHRERFDLLLVDAPCSGQSLPARGIANPGCFGPSTVNGNAKRQKGILLAAAGCVKPGGHLLYSTCTYDPDENEKVMAYLMRRQSEWEAVDVPCLSAFRSRLCDFPAYRLLPMQGMGAGGFCCLLKKRG